MKLTLQEILNLKTDLFKNSDVKLVRHADNRKEYRELIKDRDELLKYQKEQDSHKFKDCDYIISFIGQDQKKALLVGIFKVNGFEKRDNGYFYDLKYLKDFKDLDNRIVIDWGDAALAWHQWYNNPKEVIQILPQGYLGAFPELLNFVLNFDELERLIKYPDANQDWKNHLSSVNGIYMILDSNTGNQYIGSANGKDGIWQRWSEYIIKKPIGSGGNTMLKEICSNEKKYYKNFRYSILQTLPSNITQNEIVKIENLYKEKLGTKFHGLNESERVHKTKSIEN